MLKLMEPMAAIKFITLTIALLLFAPYGNAILTCDVGAATANRKVEFNIFSKKNSSGHWITNFTVNNDSPQPHGNLKVNVIHMVDCSDGIQKSKIQGILVAPPPVPQDYTLFSGVGYYKMYPTLSGFDAAENTCIKDGGHLAIVNSEPEFKVISSLVKDGAVYLGFHDRVKEGEFMTVMGQPLSSTGFVKWLPNEPNNGGGNENCGTYHVTGGFNDVPCHRNYPFICEFELGWA